MPNNPRSSFIPKQSSGMIPSAVRRRRKFNVFSFLASVFMLVSLALAGGVYLYKGYVESHLEREKLAQLFEVKA